MDSRELHWLVRKSDNQVSATSGRFAILGPYYADQIRMMIEKGMLEADDELCHENGFWFALNDVAEVKKHFGLEVDIANLEFEDIESTLPEITVPQLYSSSAAASAPVESTAMIKVPRPAPNAHPQSRVAPSQLASQFRRASIAKSLGYYDMNKSPQVLGVEKSKVWGILFLIFVILAGVGFAWLLKSLKI